MKKLILAASAACAMFAASINIEDAWVKASAATAVNSAIFLKINNTSDKDIKLINAHSDFAQNTEIHNHIHENGMMKMVRIMDLNIPAKSSVELKPRSYHIMLLGLKEPVTADSKVNVKLDFDNGESVELENIKVQELVAKAAKHHDEHAHH